MAPSFWASLGPWVVPSPGKPARPPPKDITQEAALAQGQLVILKGGTRKARCEQRKQKKAGLYWKHPLVWGGVGLCVPLLQPDGSSGTYVTSPRWHGRAEI